MWRNMATTASAKLHLNKPTEKRPKRARKPGKKSKPVGHDAPRVSRRDRGPEKKKPQDLPATSALTVTPLHAGF